MNNIPATRRKSGFTLIELLVVIAIIAILAAILFPVFARARENARRASCQSNEKNIALGFKQYIQDNGEKYPPTMVTAADLKASGSTGGLSEYIKSSAIFYCPSDSDKVTGSYGYKLTGAPNESSIADTAGTTLLNETGLRHFGGMNIAYVDGHVKWSKGGTPTTAFLSPTPTGSYGPSAAFIEDGRGWQWGVQNGGAFNQVQLNESSLGNCGEANPCPIPNRTWSLELRVILTTGQPGIAVAITGESGSGVTATNYGPTTGNGGLSTGGITFSPQYPSAQSIIDRVGKKVQVAVTFNGGTKTFHFVYQ